MSDVEVVRAIYEAMAARDYDTLFQLVDTAVVITQDERLPWGGRHEGHDGVVVFAAALTGAIESNVDIEAIFSADDEVIEMGRTKGTVVGTDRTFDIAEVHRWRIEGGKAVAAHFAIDTEAMLAALHP
jgi:ketosteroid isomerase-like protein